MKATMITLAALILAGIAAGRAEATVLKVKADGPTDLYGGQASSVGGNIRRQAGDNFRWQGSGSLTWEVWPIFDSKWGSDWRLVGQDVQGV
jgi:hypothetical protein